MLRKTILMTLVFLLSLSFNSFAKDTISGKIVIFHAGSLSVPLKYAKDFFEKMHPNVEILLESAGSRTCARKISDLKRRADIMASADYTVIDELLIPNYADWNIKFASNEMAIVYHKGSKYSDKINKDNWYEILMKDDVHFGRSDPNADPCGYRAVLTMQLAEKHYKNKGLSDKMMAKDLNFIRPKEVDLLALLEAGAIDYLFLYRSVAQQHSLNFVILPDEINLKSYKLADFYKTASMQITGKKPGEYITKKGLPMVYGITIPKTAENPEAAIAFLDFLLNENAGMRIMEDNGQPSMIPSVATNYDKIPDKLKKYAKK